VLAEDPGSFSPSTVRAAITSAAGDLDGAVAAAHGDLATRMSDAQNTVQLSAQALAIGRSTDDIGTLMFFNLNEVKKSCGELGAPINYPPSFNH